MIIAPDDIETKRKLLIHRSKYRGTKELDIFFSAFAQTHLGGFSPEELDEYQRILETHEPVLFDWISGRSAPPEEMRGPVMEKILSFVIHP